MNKNKEKLNIELTGKQYFALLKAVYLGNWIANANRDGSADDPHKDEYETIEDYIFSFAKHFGFDEYVDNDDADRSKFYPTRKFEEGTDVNELHDEYDEETFWDELCDRLGKRDFARKYSKEERKNMSDEEHFIKLQECAIAWEEEAENNGIERLEMMKTLKDFGLDV